MVDFMVKNALLKALLMCYGFDAPSDRSHDSWIGPFDSLVDGGINGRLDGRGQSIEGYFKAL